jgi:hypothetical protein
MAKRIEKCIKAVKRCSKEERVTTIRPIVAAEREIMTILGLSFLLL